MHSPSPASVSESSVQIPVASQRNLASKADSDGENPPDIPQLHNSSFIIDDREDFKDESLYTFCGSCKNHVMTMVTYKAEIEANQVKN
ncbi:uncharacterized protein [Pocillopora verrucosa]|uniref:uncharacterized protein isoform X3 n=1 Tax=Pocillopora verrucosa TaxID=203993 RepID=UPI003341BE89